MIPLACSPSSLRLIGPSSASFKRTNPVAKACLRMPKLRSFNPYSGTESSLILKVTVPLELPLISLAFVGAQQF